MLLFLAALIGLSIYLVRKCILAYKFSERYIVKSVLTVLLCIYTLNSIVHLSGFLYPFDRTVKFELYATLQIPPENTLEAPQFWHSAYDDIDGDASFFFNPEETHSHLGFDWPAMDFEHHTYIITYGQELESLSYNAWDYVRYPFFTGVKIGYAELSEEFDPNLVYVYEIERIRIDNDP